MFQESTSQQEPEVTNQTGQVKISTMPQHLELFQGQFDMLSNLHNSPVKFRGRWFTSSESAYQYTKCIVCRDHTAAATVLNAEDGLKAKIATKRVRITPQWLRTRRQILFQIMQAKYHCNEVIRIHIQNLPADTIFAECVPHSYYWATGLSKANTSTTPPHRWPGHNVAGHIWYQIKQTAMAQS